MLLFYENLLNKKIVGALNFTRNKDVFFLTQSGLFTLFFLINITKSNNYWYNPQHTCQEGSPASNKASFYELPKQKGKKI